REAPTQFRARNDLPLSRPCRVRRQSHGLRPSSRMASPSVKLARLVADLPEVCVRGHHHHRDAQVLNILLKRQIPIGSDENVEGLCCECQQFSIFLRFPAHLGYSAHFLPNKVPRYALIDAFVDQDFHFASFSTLTSAVSSTP